VNVWLWQFVICTARFLALELDAGRPVVAQPVLPVRTTGHELISARRLDRNLLIATPNLRALV
jgi:hypothetical protein